MSNYLQRDESKQIQLSGWQCLLPWLLSSFCLLLASVSHQFASAQEIDSLRKGVVKVAATLDGIQKTGTEFIVQQDTKATYIVTAAHVAADDKYPKVAFFSERHTFVETEVLQNDQRNDTSLLEVHDNTLVSTDVIALLFAAEEKMQDNNELIAIGFTPGIEWAQIPVTLALRQGTDLIFDGNLDEGNSGGPVLKKGSINDLVTKGDNRLGRIIPEKFITTELDGWDITLMKGGVVTAQFTSKPTPHEKPPTTTRLPIEPDMVAVPAGKLIMGSPKTEPGRYSNEGPQHEVFIASFAISRTEITVGQFRLFVQDKDYHGGKEFQTAAEENEKGCWIWNEEKKQFERIPQRNWKSPGFHQHDEHPAVCVSWDDAQAYVQWLLKKTGKQYRLPTEAEWEYVARAGTTTVYWWGDNIGKNNAVCGNCGSQWDGKQTAPVGSFKFNAFGVYDTSGNVWEWTQDCWHDDYTNAPTNGTAWLEKDNGDCSRRVVRGGSWGFDPLDLRSAGRDWIITDGAGYGTGFRVARDF